MREQRSLAWPLGVELCGVWSGEFGVGVRNLLLSELESYASPDHSAAAKVDMGVIVSLPEPFGPIIVDTDAEAVNVPVIVAASGFEQGVKRDAVVLVQPVPPQKVRVLLAGTETNVKNRIAIDAIVAIELVTEAELDGLRRIKEKIVKRLEVRFGPSDNGVVPRSD